MPDLIEFPHSIILQDFLNSSGTSIADLKCIGPVTSMSNTNYLFESISSGRKFVLRIDNPSNSKIIDRTIEQNNSRGISRLGLGPRVCFGDGYKLSEYIPSPTHYNKLDTDHNRAVSESLGKLHDSGEDFPNVFDPFKMADDYLNGLKGHIASEIHIRQELFELRTFFLHSLRNSDKLVPCQIDLVPENLIYSQSESKIYIIDQEYSGMYYREWDLADLASETDMTFDEELNLIMQYEDTTGYMINQDLYLVTKALCNLLWAAWALYYDENEDGMKDYYNLRYHKYAEARDYYKEMKANEQA